MYSFNLFLDETTSQPPEQTTVTVALTTPADDSINVAALVGAVFAVIAVVAITTVVVVLRIKKPEKPKRKPPDSTDPNYETVVIGPHGVEC